MGMLDKVIAAMAIGTARLFADGMNRGIAQGPRAQTPVGNHIGMAGGTVIIMVLAAGDRVTGMTPPAVLRWRCLRGGHHFCMVLMLVTDLKIGDIGGMAMPAIPAAQPGLQRKIAKMTEGTVPLVGIDHRIRPDMTGDTGGGISNMAESCRAMSRERGLKPVGMGVTQHAVGAIEGDVNPHRRQSPVFSPVCCLRMTDLTDPGGGWVCAGTAFVKGKGILSRFIQKTDRDVCPGDGAADQLPVDDRKIGGRGDVGEGGAGITGNSDGTDGWVVNGNNAV